MNGIITRITGVTYDDAQENIQMFGCKDIGNFALVREPNNTYDTNAIRVALGDKKLGYLPKAIAKELAPAMDAGKVFIALFVKRNESPFHDIVGVTVKIIELPCNLSTQECEGMEG
jgi:hypothetical protein